jgi:hypothetical protein
MLTRTGHATASGPWFLVVATEGINLSPQFARACLITAGKGDRQSKLQLLELVLTRAAIALHNGIGPALGCTTGTG